MADDDDILAQHYGPNTGSTSEFLTQYEHSSPLEPYNAARTVADTHKQGGAWGVAKSIANAWAKGGAGLIGSMIKTPLYDAPKAILEDYRPGAENEVVNQDIGKHAFDAGSTIMGGSVAPRPAGSLGTFAGVRARNADLEKLMQARELHGYGAPMGEVRDATGWHQGPDGRWRWEISDDKMEYHPGRAADIARAEARRTGEGANTPLRQHTQGYTAKVKDAMTHPELFANYPELAEAPWSVVPKDQMPDAWGTWGGLEGGATIRADVAPNLISGKRTAAHEVMGHGPQGIEQFDTGASSKMYELSTPEIESFQRMAARTEDAKFILDIMQKKNLQLVDAVGYIKDELGGRLPIESIELAGQYRRPEQLQKAADFYRERLRNARDPKKAYHNTTGEVEARNVADERLDMTPEERAEPTNAPWHTQGVKYEDQIRSPIRKAGPEPEPGSAPGMSASEILHKNYGRPIDPRMDPRLEQAAQLTDAPGRQRPFEAAFRVKGPDGKERIFTGANHGIAYDNAVAELGEHVAGPSAYAHLGDMKFSFGDDPVMGFVGPDGYLTRNEAMKQVGAKKPLTAEALDDTLTAGGNRKAAAGVAAKDILEQQYGEGAKPVVEERGLGAAVAAQKRRDAMKPEMRAEYGLDKLDFQQLRALSHQFGFMPAKGAEKIRDRIAGMLADNRMTGRPDFDFMQEFKTKP